MSYRPDHIREPVDLMIVTQSGPEPLFDAITKDFLLQSHEEVTQRCKTTSLVEVISLGREVPWVYALRFRTRGLGA